jgi:hypothetical protein
MTPYEVSTATTTEKIFTLKCPSELGPLEDMIAEVRKTMPDEVVEDGGVIHVRIDKARDQLIISYNLSRVTR